MRLLALGASNAPWRFYNDKGHTKEREKIQGAITKNLEKGKKIRITKQTQFKAKKQNEIKKKK